MTLKEFMDHVVDEPNIIVYVGNEGIVKWDQETFENNLGHNMADYEILDWILGKDAILIYTK
jgi:hypothetical protein